MNMKDAKAITIPEGTVKKIEDSNGNIIWGSQSAFPYRRLEYIQGDGKNYVITNANVTTGGNVKYWFHMAFTISGQGNSLSGSEKSNAYSTNDRFKFGTSSAGNLYCGYANGISGSAPILERFYEYYVTQGNQHIKDLSTNTNLVTGNYNLTGTNISGGNITLFGLAQGSNTNIINVTNNAGTRIKYFAFNYNNSLVEYIPVQRKSDGKCGFYNTSNNTFYVEQGSGALIAGPTVDEY